MDGVEAVCTPVSKKLSFDTSYVDPTDYRSAIGGLQYLTLARPDIAFTINRLPPTLVMLNDCFAI